MQTLSCQFLSRTAFPNKQYRPIHGGNFGKPCLEIKINLTFPDTISFEIRMFPHVANLTINWYLSPRKNTKEMMQGAYFCLFFIIKHGLLKLARILHKERRNTKSRYKESYMGIFSRFKDIINANINSLLDKAEDPEKMLRLMMQEMEDTLIDLKSACAAKMAAKAKLDRKERDQRIVAERWQERARLAVGNGKDDLAREALLERKKIVTGLTAIAKDITDYEHMIQEEKEEISQLQEKLDNARIKLRMLQEKARHAEEERKAAASMRHAESYHFDDLADKIDRMNAEADLNTQTPSAGKRFADMEMRDEIEKELEALKNAKKD